ncbi:aminotransferase class I/II-fold pyridoxal phosphate-dependent enzyme [Paenibacillaceae bacterium WGS1546]|uniref:aminotransferase class I/II-fold pyridoxal phosphate-dependent enzyme n=1 Tax=Cohnella sp. WGS1546 TaxID=3366810 RepID=UPI00372D4228
MNSIINWMGGWPKEGLVSASDWEERVEKAASFATAEAVPGASLRPGFGGDEKLREQLAKGLLKGKTGGNGALVRIANGADGALAWLVDCVLKPGDAVLTERLTSRTALQAFRKAGARTEAVEGDRKGMDPEALTTALYRHRPRMVYVAPSCTDPEGSSWSPERKEAIQRRCAEAGVLVVSDDRQENLLYEQPGKGYSQKRLEPGTLSIGQLPPGLVAGLRIGWIAGTADALQRHSETSLYRSGQGLRANAIEQKALSLLIEEQPLEPLLEMLRVQCRERKRIMTDQLARLAIPELNWVEPKGGLHLWVVLPSGLDGEALLRDAWLKGVIFQPGAPFYAKNPRANTVRITHAFADERQMRQGAARLAESIGEFTGRWSRS